jgi:hypothetical protein
MTTTTFTNAVAVKWNGVDGKMVILNGKRLWPPAWHSIGLPNDPSNDTGRVIEAYVGDSIRINANPTHGFNWIDASIAIFEVVGGQRVTPAVGPASGFRTEQVMLPDGSQGPAFNTMQDDFTIDTHGMKPGTYVLLAAQFSMYDYPGVTATIHLKPQLVSTVVMRTLDVSGSGLSQAIYDTNDNFVGPDTPVGLSVPAGGNRLYLDGLDSSVLDGLLDVADMIVSDQTDSDHMFGKNHAQDSAEGGVVGTQGHAMQTRYGGKWDLPAITKPGDFVYLNVGSGHNWFTVGKITFT